MFKMPVGLYEKALPASLSWEERLATAGEAGYDFVEISIDESDERLARLDWPASRRAELKQAIASSGIPIMTMCLSGHRKYPLGSHDPELRRKGGEILRKAIDFAGEIGLRVVQVMAYDVFYETSDETTQAYFFEGLWHGTCWAGQAGVMLGLENLDTPFVECVSQAMSVLRTIDSPWLQLYPDIGNLAAAGYHPPDELALAKGHLLGIHVKDALPKVIRGVALETGIVPFRETFRTLAQMGFWGLLGVEKWAQMHAGEDPAASAADTRRRIDGWMAEAWPDGPSIDQASLAVVTSNTGMRPKAETGEL